MQFFAAVGSKAIMATTLILVTLFAIQHIDPAAGDVKVNVDLEAGQDEFSAFSFDWPDPEPEEIIKVSKNYSLGITKEGQILVGFGSNSHEFRNQTNAQVTIKWPANKPKPNLYLTSVKVYTNSTVVPPGTDMVVFKGGYDQPSIEFGLQANNTRLLEYSYAIYAIQE